MDAVTPNRIDAWCQTAGLFVACAVAVLATVGMLRARGDASLARQPFHALARGHADGHERLLVSDGQGILLRVYDARDGRPLPLGDARAGAGGAAE